MVQEDAVKPVIQLLNALKIPYMFVGAFAVNYYAVPRFTHDADLVVRMLAEHIEDLCKPLEEHFHVDREMIRGALTAVGQFNIIHHDSGFKIDFWTVKDDEISQMQFSRRIAGRVFGLDAYIITPEDLILTKLTWFKDSGSQKHFLDAVGVFRMQRNDLGMDYLHEYAGKMNLTGLLDEVKSKSLEPTP